MSPSAALLASLLLHVGAIVAVSGHALGGATGAEAERAVADETLWLDLEPPPAVGLRATGEGAHHHHDYPVPHNHDARPHDPRAIHWIAATEPPERQPEPRTVLSEQVLSEPVPSEPVPSEPVPSELAPSEPVRFELPAAEVLGTLPASPSVAPSGPTPSGASSGSISGPSSPSQAGAIEFGAGASGLPRASSSGNATDGGPDARGGRGLRIFDEGDVSQRARLLRSATLVYPAAARSAEKEGDVAFEIVVDERGRVESARVLGPRGYGLEQAATRAILGYEFAPAERHGRAVRVRMHWTIQFRLR